MSHTTSQGIYFGPRGSNFRTFIQDVLKSHGINPKYVDILTSPSNMPKYEAAFTSDSVDPNNNYQVYEQIGDLSGNKFIVNYMYERFPQLDCTEGVKVVARLRINYGAKQSFSEIARRLGFWPYISATHDIRQRRMKSLLEDVFEAFLGVTERIMDRSRRVGVGYAIVYDFLASVFDGMDISLQYSDLYDAKTRLKELFDTYETQLGPLVYKDRKTDKYTHTVVYRIDGGVYGTRPDGTPDRRRMIGGKHLKLGEGRAALKANAQQQAAEQALRYLKTQGWYKEPPRIYRAFSAGAAESSTREVDLGDIANINDLTTVRSRSKYQVGYQCTPLTLYCKKRDARGVDACIRRGANPNIQDSEGLTCMDRLLIGAIDPDIVRPIACALSKQTDRLQVSKGVYDLYATKYVDDDLLTLFSSMHLT